MRYRNLEAFIKKELTGKDMEIMRFVIIQATGG